MKEDIIRLLFVIIMFGVLIVFACTLVSCKTQQPTIVEKVVTNTEYVDRWRIDSVYVDNVKYIDRGGDTIRIVEQKIEYRYKVLTDSIEVLKVDSIPYEVQVVEIVERMNNHQRTMYWLGWLAVLIVGLRLFWKVYKKFKL